MARYKITKKAVEDLTSIWDYTCHTWSENQADKYYFELLNDCQTLAENRILGKAYEDINKEIFGYKSGQHIIFYRILNETEIEITRFLHSRMDLKNRINE